MKYSNFYFIGNLEIMTMLQLILHSLYCKNKAWYKNYMMVWASVLEIAIGLSNSVIWSVTVAVGDSCLQGLFGAARSFVLGCPVGNNK